MVLFVFIFKLWRGGKKSQWVACFSISFLFTFSSFYRDGLYLSEEKHEEKVLYFLKGDVGC